MIQRAYTAWLFGAALTLVSFGTGAAKATAQTTYPFEATYNTQTTSTEIAPGISEVTITAESVDAPYSLTNLNVETYSQINPNTGVVTFNEDPATFGLEGLPILSDVTISSNDGDQLFLDASNITASINFENQTLSGSGISIITGGAGRFEGAIGELTFTQTDVLSPDPTAPSKGQALVTGSFQTPEAVPEPRTEATLVGIGAIAVGFLLRRHRQRSIV